MKFVLLSVSPRQGLDWVRDGLMEWRRQPLAYTSLLMVFMLVMALCAQLPKVGGLLLMMAVPLLSLTYMMATRASLTGHRPGLGAFAAPWVTPGPHRAALGLLCVSYALLSASAMWLGDWVDGGALDALIDTLNNPKASEAQMQQQLQAPGLLAGVLVRLVLTLLISLPYWHAPALVVWAHQSAAQAMFSSTLALWRARWAFLLYGLGWMGVALAASTVLNLALVALGGGSLSQLVMMLTGLVLTSAYYASLFFSFSQCFAVEE